jgi:ubiquinone/menaquinone biosynthesis C-methylase UbiE
VSQATAAAPLRGAGFYEGRVFPWINDKLCSDPELQRIRAAAVAPARGRVIEIGFGSGLNVPHYGAAVTQLVAIEPNAGMLERAQPRIRDAAFPVEVIASTAERLPLPDRSFDTAVSVLTLCSVSDPAQVLGELHRVLRDDGQLLLVEHGLADDAGVARWQNRLDWLQGKLACGCHLNRPVARLAQAAGFRTEQLEQYFAPKMPRTHGWVTVGTSLKQ